MGVTILNSTTILTGCIIGILIKEKMTEKISSTIMNRLALCVLYIGRLGSLEDKNILISNIYECYRKSYNYRTST